MIEPQERADARHLAGVLGGVVAVSWASILIRLADAPALVIAFYRTAGAGLLLLAWALLPGRSLRWSRALGSAGGLLLAGLFLALHFAAWVASLDHTTVASSVVIVTANPFLVVVFSWLLWREPLGRKRLAGVLLAVGGAVVIGWGDFSLSGEALLGDVLALAGAVGIAAYYMAGGRLRARLGLLEYLVPVYLSAGLILLIAIAVLDEPLAGFGAETYACLAALAVVPQLIGHSLLNWGLRYFSAAFVATAVLGEPVGATVLAYAILHETPPGWTLAGAVLVGGGLYLVALSERDRRRAGPQRRRSRTP
jgi:drug/metabolite transporter (DMT)-like permease